MASLFGIGRLELLVELQRFASACRPLQDIRQVRTLPWSQAPGQDCSQALSGRTPRPFRALPWKRPWCRAGNSPADIRSRRKLGYLARPGIPRLIDLSGPEQAIRKTVEAFFPDLAVRILEPPFDTPRWRAHNHCSQAHRSGQCTIAPEGPYPGADIASAAAAVSGAPARSVPGRETAVTPAQ